MPELDAVKKQGKDATPEDLAKIIEILSPLHQSSRMRLVKAAIAFLNIDNEKGLTSIQMVPEDNLIDSGEAAGNWTPSVRVSRWLAQNHLNATSIENVFHFPEGGPPELIINNLLEDSVKGQVQNAYLLCGVLALLERDTPKFGDDDAREICRSFNAYDTANHASYVKTLSRYLSGGKSAGWELTRPGLVAAAELIKGLNDNV